MTNVSRGPIAGASATGAGESSVRRGALGSWDRIVGPGATAVETAGTVGLALAGAVFAGRATRPAPVRAERLLRAVLAADLWGGAWCNLTPAAARWYHRDGQGPVQHLAFSAAHVHPFVVALLDTSHGRPWPERLRWAVAQYGWVLLVTAVVGRCRRPDARRVIALAGTAGGIALDARLGRSATVPWFGLVLHVKLLAGHAGAVLVRDVGSSTASNHARGGRRAVSTVPH